MQKRLTAKDGLRPRELDELKASMRSWPQGYHKPLALLWSHCAYQTQKVADLEQELRGFRQQEMLEREPPKPYARPTQEPNYYESPPHRAYDMLVSLRGPARETYLDRARRRGEDVLALANEYAKERGLPPATLAIKTESNSEEVLPESRRDGHD